LERAPDESAAQRAGREVADAVGFHPRLLEQPPVDRELPVGRLIGLGQCDVVFDRPALGVPGVERLVAVILTAGRSELLERVNIHTLHAGPSGCRCG